MLVESTPSNTLGSKSNDGAVIDQCISTIQLVTKILLECEHCKAKLLASKVVSI